MEKEESPVGTHRSLRLILNLGRHHAFADHRIIFKWYEMFMLIGSAIDVSHSGPENVEAVKQSFLQFCSYRSISQKHIKALGLSVRTVKRILLVAFKLALHVVKDY